MDRTVTKAVKRLGIALAALAMSGPGCAKMRTYRSQDSPLPGRPLIGRAKARARRGQVDPPDTAGAGAPRRGDVAWSGEPNTAPPIAKKTPRSDLATPEPRLLLPVAGDQKPAAPVAAKAIETPGPDVAKVRDLIQRGRDRMAKVATYQVSVDGQERVNGTLQPEDEARLSVRREPRAIRLEWPNGQHKGREVLWSSAEPGGMMHVHVGDSMLPVPDLALSPTNPMILKYSRHPVTEAGLDSVLDRLDESLKPHEGGTSGTEKLSYDGLRTPPEIGRPCHTITRVTPSGETWIVSLDAETCLPTVVVATDAKGDLLERYLFRDVAIDPPALSDSSAFDPEKRWGGSRGLLGRLAQGGTGGTPSK